MNPISKFACLSILSLWVWGTFVQHADGAIHILLGVGLYGSLLCLLHDRVRDARSEAQNRNLPLLLCSSNTGKSLQQCHIPGQELLHSEDRKPQSGTGEIHPPRVLDAPAIERSEICLALPAPRPFLHADDAVVEVVHTAPMLENTCLCKSVNRTNWDSWITVVQTDEAEEKDLQNLDAPAGQEQVLELTNTFALRNGLAKPPANSRRSNRSNPEAIEAHRNQSKSTGAGRRKQKVPLATRIRKA